MSKKWNLFLKGGILSKFWESVASSQGPEGELWEPGTPGEGKGKPEFLCPGAAFRGHSDFNGFRQIQGITSIENF